MHERSLKRIAIVGAGDMGSSVAAELRRNGFDVSTCLEGRSNRSRKLSTRAGMRAVENLETLVADADLLFSIIPPAAAVEFARRAAAMLAARQLGVSDELQAELAHSLPDVHKAMHARMPNIACDAARWTGEMREIASTYRDAGLTSGFHEGAEWIYEILSNSPIAEESRDEADAKKRSLNEVTEIYHRTLLDYLGRV